MTKLRKGDIVTFKAVVTDVAKFNSGQQIMAKVLPNGEALGWCIPTENAFEPAELKLRAGDRVKWSQRSTDPTAVYEILFLVGKQATVRKEGREEAELAELRHLTRL